MKTQNELCYNAAKIAIYNLAKNALAKAKQSRDIEKIRIAQNNLDKLMGNL